MTILELSVVELGIGKRRKLSLTGQCQFLAAQWSQLELLKAENHAHLWTYHLWPYVIDHRQ